MICNFTVECCNAAIAQTNEEKRANNVLWTLGELSSRPFPKVKICISIQNLPQYSVMQKRSIVQDNSDITKQSLSSIPFIKLRGHFGNVFLKPSAVFLLLTIFVPRAHDPSGLWQGSRALAWPDFQSMRRVFVSYSQPIKFARFDGKSVNRIFPVLDQASVFDPYHRLEGSWALGTRTRGWVFECATFLLK